MDSQGSKLFPGIHRPFSLGFISEGLDAPAVRASIEPQTLTVTAERDPYDENLKNDTGSGEPKPTR